MRRWVRWRLERNRRGDLTKRPQGSTRDVDALLTFTQVEQEFGSPTHGAGLVFTGRLPGAQRTRFLVALDVDACRDPETGELGSWWHRLRGVLPATYTEISPSGFGLRVLLWVRNLPPSCRIMYVRGESNPPGCSKHGGPQIQVFGCGAAGYVTITGDVVDASPIATVEDLAPVFAEFGGGAQEDALPDAAMPQAAGDAPDIADLTDRVARAPDSAALIHGDYEALGLPSASEVYWRLVRTVLPAASNDGELALRFLLTRTDYGLGVVSSREPDRYMDERWVRAEILRIAGKRASTPAQNAFADFDCETWRPPARTASGWLQPVAEFVVNGRRERFLVKGVLPAQGIAQMFGAFSSGKTPVALSLALHVAMGLPEWFGHVVKIRGPVVYLIGEDPSGIRDRILAQTQALDPLIDYSEIPLFLSRHPAQLTQPKNRAQWAREIRDVLADAGQVEREPSLIVIDTQSANLGPGDENSTETMLAFVDEVNTLARQMQCLVLLVHHSGLGDALRARGSGTVANALDAQFRVARSGSTVTVVPTKSKNWRDPAPLIGYLEPVAIAVDEDGDAVTAITVTDVLPDPGEIFSGDDHVATLLAMLGEAPVTTTQRELADLTGLHRGSLRRALERAEDLGLLSVQRGDTQRAPVTYTRQTPPTPAGPPVPTTAPIDRAGGR
jgi:hypothetical protein